MSPAQPGFPVGRTLAALSAGAAAMLALELWIVPALFVGAQGATRAVWIMSTVVWASALLSVLPVWRAGLRDPLLTVRAYFKGAGVRIVICLAAMVVAVKAMLLPAGPVVVALMATYLPLMFIEVAMVVRFLRKAEFPRTRLIVEALP